MEEHANYSPSRLKRIMSCPGSVKLIDDLTITSALEPAKPSVYAQKGTDLHGIFLNYYNFTKDYGKHNEKAMKDLDTDDKFLITECADYLDILIASKKHKILGFSTETMVSLEPWGIPEVWGTSDCMVIDHVKCHADILDWKFGSGVTVYAKENPQLLAYAAGRIGWPTSIKTLTLHIVQPAIDHFDTWDLTIDDLYKWVHNDLATAIWKTIQPDPKLIPGIEQCRWCEAKNHCYARTNLVHEEAAKLFDAQKTLAQCPSKEDLAEIIKLAPLVENAIKSIVQFATKELELGHGFPGYKLVEGRANRRWKDEGNVIKWLSEHTKIEELFTSKLKSPSQIEKEDKTLKRNELFKDLYEKPPGKPTLTVIEDKRPEIPTASEAIDVFKDFPIPEILE